MNRLNDGVPSGESQDKKEADGTGDGREVTRALMAQAAFKAAQNESSRPLIHDGGDVFVDAVTTYGGLTPATTAALPDFLVVDDEYLCRPRRVEPDGDFMRPPSRPRLHEISDEQAGRREAHRVAVDEWGDEQTIAELAGIPVEIIRRFIEKHRDKLGSVFSAPEMRRRTEKGKSMRTLAEHYSPQFIEWAVASLQDSLQRLESQRALELIDKDLSSE